VEKDGEDKNGSAEHGSGAGRVPADEIESLMSQLPGVISTRIVVNDWGAIEEVHVLSTTQRNPKQIVRDIESCLAARWGLNVDHKKISIAQVRGAELPSDFRLALHSLEVRTEATRGLVRVTVGLRTPGEDGVGAYEGSAVGPRAGMQPLRVGAQAAVQALNEALAESLVVGLEDANLIHVGGSQLVVVVVSLLNDRGDQELLSGSALVRVDPVESAVRATLDAVNRRVACLPRKGPARRSEETDPEPEPEDESGADKEE